MNDGVHSSSPPPEDGETGHLLSAARVDAAASVAAASAAAAALRRWRLLDALACVAGVAAIWVGAAALTQYLIVDLRLRAPTLLTAINSAEFPLVLLPLAAVREHLGGRAAAAPAGGRSACSRCAPALGAPRSDWRAAARAGLAVCPLWLAAQGAYNASLLGTSVSSATVLASTSCVFTFLFACIWLRARGSRVTAGGVLLTVAGAALVGWGDEDAAARDGAAASSQLHTWWGDALALASAAAYALYSTAIKVLVPPPAAAPLLPSVSRVLDQPVGGDSAAPHTDVECAAPAGAAPAPPPPRISVSVFFGFLGLFTALLLAPLVAALHASGVEDLRAVVAHPAPGELLALALGKGLLDNVLADLLWARAIQLTDPTLAAAGLSLTIPLALLSDAVVRGVQPSLLTGTGAGVVAAGFVLCALGAA